MSNMSYPELITIVSFETKYQIKENIFIEVLLSKIFKCLVGLDIYGQNCNVRSDSWISS